ncbi:uncharacterized protein PGTG_02528 [Puccinia graminis f. sp. tritici CRL 75-36-700-3]|uniref:Uncharacterized protein n=1 Tax=Puccinia graminis f. sp. tritici (strain CRL 75-36-700-3 / race SCCL) TaxID=418459 RepID=E3JVL2_PUCGT|nr:uncharacterized protein PGTG_02528 [Puccinia graminis f. sp. tritici CRL 75-36-700-3]EFP76087.2 hypothetical protein PGTG_02528 [Puccinia graminis f. sp. tritici CRL 75-36-700-3]
MASVNLNPVNPDYPLVRDIYTVIPAPPTRIPVLKGGLLATHVLRSAWNVNRSTPSFPNHPHLFTIPGHSLFKAQEFAKAMMAPIMWNIQKISYSSLDSSHSNGNGHHAEFFFKLDYQCPCSGNPMDTPEIELLPKENHQYTRFGCKAQFSVSHHIKTNSLRVVWHWRHNHSLRAELHHRLPIITCPPIRCESYNAEELVDSEDASDLEIVSHSMSTHAVSHHDIKIIRQATGPKKSQIDRTGSNLSQTASPSPPKQDPHSGRPAASCHARVQTALPAEHNSPVECFDETCRPKFCTCPTLVRTTEPVSEFSGESLGTEEEMLSMKEKLERSGSLALKEIVRIMKDINKRSEFLRNVSPLLMERYMRSMYAILKMTTLKWVEVSGVSKARQSNDEDSKTKNLILGFDAAGRKYLRRTMMLVDGRKYRERFCVHSSFDLVDQYQECCWDLLDMVINNCPSLQEKKRRRNEEERAVAN